MNSAFKHYAEPSSVPTDSIPIFGANPAWSPEREGRAPAGLRPGKVEAQPKLTCDACGGYMEAEAGNDTLGPITTAIKVSMRKNKGVSSWVSDVIPYCPACTRTPADGTKAMDRAVRPNTSAEAAGTDRSDSGDRTTLAVGGPPAKAAPARPVQLGYLLRSDGGKVKGRKARSRPGR